MSPVIPLAAARQRPAGTAARTAPAPDPDLRLGEHLLASGALSPETLHQALAEHSRMDIGFDRFLLAKGHVSAEDLDHALACQYRAGRADFTALPPDPRLIDVLGAARCLRDGVLPWRRVAGATLIATCRPEQFAEEVRKLPAALMPAIMVLCRQEELAQAIARQRAPLLACAAESRVSDQESCRFWYGTGPRAAVAIGLAVLAIATLLAPLTLLAGLTLWAVACMILGSALKLMAAIAQMRARRGTGVPDAETMPTIARLPTVSILVPLYRETEIAPRLIARLARLDYPKPLLDICLVTEANDTATRSMLERADLPHWMRTVTVPEGQLKTKPRALNYALEFCHGSIIGVYDAEDAPAPDQIRKVVDHFHSRGPEVACLQGVLDFYNARTNWLARCFTVEYASWFRVILPGLARLGLPVPLGGTTLFFRRRALESLGGWDAHNVTEDADLGLRLARHGFRTEFLDSVTEEEANCRAWPWVRQRSRWLKGYAMTWTAHMRRPYQLWRQLGGRGFLGVQLLFLGTLSQFMLAPLLWSFWGLAFGWGHPLAAMLPHGGMTALFIAFLMAELVNLGVSALGLSFAGKRGLVVWVPTLHLYFPLASLASYKAVWEMAVKPFFWDKTRHGLYGRTGEDVEATRIIGKVRKRLRRRAVPITLPPDANPRHGEDGSRTQSRYGA